MNETDIELLRQMITGNEIAGFELIRRYGMRLRSFVQRQLSQSILVKVDPDDVVQRTWESVIQANAETIETIDSFEGWILGICQKRCADVSREFIALKRDISKETAISGSSFLAEQLAGSFSTPSSRAKRKETFIVLQERIERLSETDRQIIYLRHFDDVTNEEIAELLEITPQAASMRHLRAIEKLSQITKDLED